MNRDLNSVIPVRPLPAAPIDSRTASTRESKNNFQNVLHNELARSQELKFSAHAEKRMKERKIILAQEDLVRIDQAVRQGKALYAGISSYNPEKTKQAAEILRQLGTPCLIHQPNYSMFNRWIEDGLIDVLEANGIGSIAFCPLAQGLLTNKYLSGIPENSRASRPTGFLKADQISPEKVSRISKLNEIALARGQSLAQMALAWVLREGHVTSALIGASRVGQIEENVKALDNLSFTDDELNAIDTI
jgi:L-glyceraldehyde 3-phosphate reductase